MSNVRWIAGVVGVVLLSGVVGAAPVEPVRLGVLYEEFTPGKPETSGSPILAGDLAKASSHGALLRLDNGQLLRFRANSAALIENGRDGLVSVTVLSGRVASVNGHGDPLLAGYGSRFMLAPSDGDSTVAERRLLALDLERTHRRDSAGVSR